MIDQRKHIARFLGAGAIAALSAGGAWAVDLDLMLNANDNQAEVMADFIEFLRPGSIIGKFGGPIPGAPGRNYPSLNRVGFNERVSGMSTGYTAAWRGEGLPAIPSAAVTFNTTPDAAVGTLPAHSVDVSLTSTV